MKKRGVMSSFCAEVFSTFTLVFYGTGAVVVDVGFGRAIGHGGVAAAFGLVVMVMIYAFGGVSGAHMNPAVTLGLWAAGWFPRERVLGYVVAQCAGAFAASGLLIWMFPATQTLGETLPAGPVTQSFWLEVILTAILMVVILRVAKEEMGPVVPALAIGATIGLEALVAGPVCGASMNPARSLAPAVVSGHTQHLWVYLLAPVVGAVAVARASRLLPKERIEDRG